MVKDVHRSTQVPPYNVRCWPCLAVVWSRHFAPEPRPNSPLLQEEGVRRVVEEIKTLNTHVEDYVQCVLAAGTAWYPASSRTPSHSLPSEQTAAADEA